MEKSDLVILATVITAFVNLGNFYLNLPRGPKTEKSANKTSGFERLTISKRGMIISSAIYIICIALITYFYSDERFERLKIKSKYEKLVAKIAKEAGTSQTYPQRWALTEGMYSDSTGTLNIPNSMQVVDCTFHSNEETKNYEQASKCLVVDYEKFVAIGRFPIADKIIINPKDRYEPNCVYLGKREGDNISGQYVCASYELLSDETRTFEPSWGRSYKWSATVQY